VTKKCSSPQNDVDNYDDVKKRHNVDEKNKQETEEKFSQSYDMVENVQTMLNLNYMQNDQSLSKSGQTENFSRIDEQLQKLRKDLKLHSVSDTRVQNFLQKMQAERLQETGKRKKPTTAELQKSMEELLSKVALKNS
jgi:hypothetical protein